MKMRNCNKILHIILYVIFLISCNTQKDKNEVVVTSSLIKIDTLSVHIDENYMQNYTSLRNRIFNGQLYAYNVHQHTIDIFDFSTQNFIAQIKLQKEGPDGVPNINSFIVTNEFIILQNESDYTIIDYNGHIIKRISKEKLTLCLDKKDYLLDAPNNISVSNFEDMVYDFNGEKIIVPISTSDPFKLKGKHCLASIDINTEEISLLSPIYPDNLNNEYYGKLSRPNPLITKDRIIYNFNYSSDVYSLEKSSKTINTYHITSDFTKEKSEQLDKNANINKQLDHYFHSLFYHGLQYDNYRNLFYRIHTDKSNDKSVFNNKETYLTIISEDMKKIAEIKLPTNLYPIFNITEKGLIFQFMTGLYEDKYSYMIITSPYIMPVNKIEPTPKAGVASTMDKSTVDKSIVDKPTVNKQTENDSFEVISLDNIKDFVVKNLVYPPLELENGVEGAVFIILESDNSGAIHSCKISDIATSTDNEALRNEAIRIAKLVKRISKNSIFSFHVNFNKEEYLLRKSKKQ